MTPLFVERVTHPEPHGTGYEQFEQMYRRVLAAGSEISIDAGKRAEYEVPRGERAVLYVMEGSVRFESDDTEAGPGDVVELRAAPFEGRPVLGLQADLPFRGVLVTGQPGRA